VLFVRCMCVFECVWVVFVWCACVCVCVCGVRDFVLCVRVYV